MLVTGCWILIPICRYDHIWVFFYINSLSSQNRKDDRSSINIMEMCSKFGVSGWSTAALEERHFEDNPLIMYKHTLFYCTLLLRRYWLFYKLKVCGNSESISSISVILSIACAHFMSCVTFVHPRNIANFCSIIIFAVVICH